MFSTALSLLCAAFYVASLPVNASCSNRQTHLSDLRVTRSGILLFIACVPYILLTYDNRGVCMFFFFFIRDLDILNNLYQFGI